MLLAIPPEVKSQELPEVLLTEAPHKEIVKQQGPAGFRAPGARGKSFNVIQNLAPSNGH